MSRILFYTYKKKYQVKTICLSLNFSKKLKKSHNGPLFLWATAQVIPTQYKNQIKVQKLDTLS